MWSLNNDAKYSLLLKKKTISWMNSYHWQIFHQHCFQQLPILHVPDSMRRPVKLSRPASQNQNIALYYFRGVTEHVMFGKCVLQRPQMTVYGWEFKAVNAVDTWQPEIKGEFVLNISNWGPNELKPAIHKTCELVEEAEWCREAQLMKLSGTLIHTGVAQP